MDTGMRHWTDEHIDRMERVIMAARDFIDLIGDEEVPESWIPAWANLKVSLGEYADRSSRSQEPGRGGKVSHELRVCVFTEGDFARRLRLGEFCGLNSWDDIDALCEQLYMDRLGHGINGISVTRKRC